MKRIAVFVISLVSFSLFACGTKKNTASTQPPSPKGTMAQLKAEKRPMVRPPRAAASGHLFCGTIIQDRKAPHTHQGPFAITPDSHAIVKLMENAPQDTAATVLLTQRIPSVSKLPIPFCLKGSRAKRFATGSEEYTLSAVVFSGKGDSTVVGDLTTETMIHITSTTKNLTVTATGLEHCNTPGSGGFCTKKTRTKAK